MSTITPGRGIGPPRVVKIRGLVGRHRRQRLPEIIIFDRHHREAVGIIVDGPLLLDRDLADDGDGTAQGVNHGIEKTAITREKTPAALTLLGRPEPCKGRASFSSSGSAARFSTLTILPPQRSSVPMYCCTCPRTISRVGPSGASRMGRGTWLAHAPSSVDNRSRYVIRFMIVTSAALGVRSIQTAAAGGAPERKSGVHPSSDGSASHTSTHSRGRDE